MCGSDAIIVTVDFSKPEVCITQRRSGKIHFDVSLGLATFTGVTSMQQPIDSIATLRVRVTDRFGNPAQTDGPVSIAIASPDLGSVTLAPDDDGSGTLFLLTPLGPLGTTQIEVKADADLGEGIVPLTGILPVEFVAGAAVNIGFDVVAQTPFP
jgi:hypothetical protein